MKKLLILLYIVIVTSAFAQDTAHVYRYMKPIVVDREINTVANFVINNVNEGEVLNSVEVNFNENDLNKIAAIAIYTDQMVLIANVKDIKKHVELTLDKKLEVGENKFYISVKANTKVDLTATVDFKVSNVVVSENPITVSYSGYENRLRFGVVVRNHGDDSVAAYRIPALETAADGALLAVYDIRRNNSMDLQEDVQVGLSRSYDKGRTWLPMQMIVDMRGYNGLPDDRNGVGDAAIVADQQTGEVWAMALWTHGIKGIAWWNVKQGLTPEEGAAQVVVAKSNDNGKTWAEPINVTQQIKDPSWYILLQGPGKGIIMKDKTLVFPFQYVDSSRMPHATIVYSKDRGNTWTIGKSARLNTTEAQVVELDNGELMLNIRDNRGASRAVMTTKDLGQSWIEHSSNRGALVEPVCMASLIKVDADKNNFDKEMLIFSNPNSTKKREQMTIKVSLDNGKTWHEENQILLDSEESWGYSCVTMIDQNTVGILYESSVAHMLFQTIMLKDIIKKIN